MKMHHFITKSDWEKAKKYPHIYGPLNINEVEQIQEFTPNEERVFDQNEVLIKK